MPALSKGMPLRSSRRTLTLALTPTPTLSLDPDPYPRPKPQVRRRAARGSRAGDTALRPRRPRWGARRRPSCWARRGGGGAHLGGAGRVARAWLERSSSWLITESSAVLKHSSQLSAPPRSCRCRLRCRQGVWSIRHRRAPGAAQGEHKKGVCRWRATQRFRHGRNYTRGTPRIHAISNSPPR